MNGEDSSLPPAESIPELPPAPPPRDPFWGYSDLLLFAGLSLPAMLAGYGLVKSILFLARIHPARGAEAVVEQFVGYLFVFMVLVVIFRLQYGKPFWRSLGWNRLPVPPGWMVIAGVLTAFAVVALGYAVRPPTTDNPLTEMLKDRHSMVLIAIFGVSLGPVAEELIFRGFLQPLLVRSIGVAAGILVTAAAFGLLHFPEYGNSWKHAVLISVSGIAFGVMRHATGSTKASSLMHAAYNALFFASLFAQGRS